MAKVALKDWKEQIRDPKIECMSRDEMTALQSERQVTPAPPVFALFVFFCMFFEISRGLKISVNFHLRQKKI